jgi:hypothetical protein
MIIFRGGIGVCLALLVGLAAEVAMGAEGTYAVYRSGDGGRTWARADAGLAPESRINAFAVSGGTVLAGTDRGISLSSDQGLHWKLSPGAGPLGRVLSLATMGGTVFAGTERNGIAASTDGGLSWARVEGARFNKVRALLAHEGALYAGSDAQGIFMSRNAGRTWEAIGAGLPAGAQVFSLAGIEGRMFAGLYGKGLFVWPVGSTLWRKAGAVSPLVLAAGGGVLIAGQNPGGVFRSVDLGTTWERGEIAKTDGLGQAPVWELAAAEGFAIAGMAAGVYRSEDGGRQWGKLSGGLPAGGAGIAFCVQPGFVLGAVFVPAKQLASPGGLVNRGMNWGAKSPSGGRRG